MTSRRRLARIARAVSRAALRTPRPVPAPVDFAEFPSTLRAAVALAPALPPRAWSTVATMVWNPRDPGPESVTFAHTVARNGHALAHLAAVVTRHMLDASRCSRRARACAAATIERETRPM